MTEPAFVALPASVLGAATTSKSVGNLQTSEAFSDRQLEAEL